MEIYQVKVRYLLPGRLLIWAALSLLATMPFSVIAQSKVDAPQTFRGRSVETIKPEQVRACLFLAKEISELTDRANVAKSRGNIEAFNLTVAPYNAAIARWNAGCTQAYDPGDMIRAENESGLRLCKFTSTPCLTEAERLAVLGEVVARQGHPGAQEDQLALQRTTGRVRNPTTIERSSQLPAASDDLLDADCASPTTPFEISACASNELAQATEEINATYNGLRRSLSPEGAAQLKAVQLLWIKYKDAACELESKSAYGEYMQPISRNKCLSRLTKVRHKELNLLK